ncbi:MAG: VWA domain-containing protein [Planctomycetota bacterium]|nr:VWA domain-containing protein [Planctomycetota bacterium]
MMEIRDPFWLWLVLPVGAAFLVWRGRATGAWGRPVLQAAILLSCLAALADVSIPSDAGSMHRVYVLDTSRSFERNEARAREMMEEQARTLGPHDRVALVTFSAQASVPVPSGPPDRLLDLPSLPSPGSRTATNIEAGLRQALLEDPHADIVLFSDGRETTGRAIDAVAAARSAGVRIFPVDLGIADLPDLRVDGLRCPAEVSAGEPFGIEGIVVSAHGGGTSVRLVRTGSVPQERFVVLRPGIPRRIRFEDRIPKTGTYGYKLTLGGLPAEANLENNTGQARVRVGEGIEVLALTRSPARVLPIGGLPGVRLTVRTPEEVGPVRFADLILLDNLSRDELGERRIDEIAMAVKEGGAGIFVLGGKRSFGPGGYAGSVLDDLLPLASDPQESSSREISLAIVLDASGSMASTVQGESKFRRAVTSILPIPALGENDRLEVITFRDDVTVAVPLGPVRSQSAIREALLRTSPGGGTRLFPPLARAVKDLAGEGDRVRHVIVLSDGRSDESDETWEEWEEICRADPDVTVSVIAVGHDVDEPRLAEIARVGRGRYRRILGISDAVAEFFRQEVSLARGRLTREGRVEVELVGGGGPVSGLSPPPPLEGFVATAAREGATIYMQAGAYPILGGWRVGAGRALAFPSALHTRWGLPWRSWADLSTFLSQGIRWAARPSDLGGLEFRLELKGDGVYLEVEEDDSAAGKSMRKLWVSIGREDPISLRPIGARTYGARFSPPSSAVHLLLEEDVPGGRKMLGMIPWSLGGGLEMRDLSPHRSLLERIAAMTGGVYGPAHGAIAGRSRATDRPLRPWLLGSALVLLILELGLGLTRIGRRPMVRSAARQDARVP